ncbi:MAG: right-handed parallel beta-helix repeat-containing protein, partial [candidate division SR1 bacterium]|nr:right-handed parallel beta-helix repeat-containing protein [candidate division SR1 bacterium]
APVWNNDNFIDDSFRVSGPTASEIKNALYGDGTGNADTTAYTKYRTGALCNPNIMTVTYVNSGINTLAAVPAANTIYVLNGGTYVSTTNVAPGGNCIAIIGRKRSTLTHSAVQANGAVYLASRQNVVLDNLEIDAKSNGTGGTHYSTLYAIQIATLGNNTLNNIATYNTRSAGVYLNIARNSVLNNVQSYNNKLYGVYIAAGSDKTMINNVQTYSNMYGIYDVSSNILFNNIQSYNNLIVGIYMSLITGSSINNAQTYNNINNGIWLSNTTGIVINNSSLYGNAINGLLFDGGTNQTKINNVSLFNNSTGYASTNVATQTGNYYYGTIKIFANGDNNTFGTRIFTGWSEYTGIGWLTGSVSRTDVLGCDKVTNSDGFLYHPTDTSCSFRGTDGSMTIDDMNQSYFYGSGVANQIQPVYYTGGTLNFSNLPYDPTQDIGQKNSVSSLGYLKFKDNKFLTDITGVAVYMGYDKIGATYLLTGDFMESPMTGATTGYSQKINISLTSSTGEKNIYITLTSGENTRNFASSILYIGPISNATIQKYFGYASAYTQNREYNSCDPRNITVTTINSGINTIPVAPVVNTIYVLNPGVYTSTGTKPLLECDVIAGSGDVFHGTDIYRANTTFTTTDSNNIIDNIKFDGKKTSTGFMHGGNSAAVYSTLASNITISNVDIYNHVLGLSRAYSKNILIDDSSIYNMYSGTVTSYGIRFNVGANIALNNIRAYNMYTSNIINSSGASNISINNTLSFSSRQQSINIASPANFIINNSLIYNNGWTGVIATTSTGIIINNVSSFNNSGAGFALENRNIYYGINSSFANVTNALQGFTGGLELGYLGWTTGSFVSTGIMSCDQVVNPIDASGSYLQTGALCNYKTYNSLFSGYVNNEYGYVYGANIPNQVQPVYYKNQEEMLSDISYDTGLYIAESPLSVKIVISSHLSGSFATSSLITLSGTIKQGSSSLSGQIMIISGDTISGTTAVSDSGGVRSVSVSLLGLVNAFSVQTTDLDDGYIIIKNITINVSNALPLVSTGYIGLGATGSNGGRLYYKGTVNISANVSDGGAGLSGDSCQYTTGAGRASAVYSGVAGYCEATGIVGGDLNIIFRVANTYGSLGTGATGTYLYDNTGPSIPSLLSPSSGQVLSTGTVNLLRSGSVDTGIGLSGYIWQISTGNAFAVIMNSGSIFTSGVTVDGLTDNRYYWRVYAYDRFENTGAWSTVTFSRDMIY